MTATATTAPAPAKLPWWTPGDWNAFFGFGTNILVNVLVLTGLLRFVLKLPDPIIFGRILPAVGLMLFLSTVYYAWLGRQLAIKTGRTDVCALPSGISVPHMFVVVFVVMLPILISTGNPVEAWGAGLTWVFIQSFVLIIGGFIAPVIRRITPRAALLGSLAGISSGANVLGALATAERSGADKTIVTIVADTGSRYFSTDLFACRKPRS